MSVATVHTGLHYTQEYTTHRATVHTGVHYTQSTLRTGVNYTQEYSTHGSTLHTGVHYTQEYTTHRKVVGARAFEPEVSHWFLIHIVFLCLNEKEGGSLCFVPLDHRYYRLYSLNVLY